MAYRETLPQKFNRKYLVGLVLLLALIGLVGVIKPRHHVDASNFTYVTVHYDGTTQTVATEAHTIGEVLDRAHIPVSAKDDVEPARDTALLSNDYNVNVYRARPVTVVDGQNSYHIFTAAQSPKEIVQAAGVSTYPEDQITMSRVNDFVSEGTIGLKATVKRSVPITVSMYGTPTQIRTQASTVQALLAEKHIKLDQGDEVSPGLSTPITAGMTISLLRNGIQVLTVQEDVPFTTKSIQDADQPVGYKKVQTPGQNGTKLVTYQVDIQHGQEASRKEVNSIQQIAPVQQVEVVGTKQQVSGDFGAALSKLRQCESGGNYANKNNPSFRGAYQFGYSTWGNYGGYYDPADAPAAVQDQAATDLYQRRGWQPWSCARIVGLQDVYR